MLKLTNSFCRYLRVTYEGLNFKVNLRRFAQLSIKSKRCVEGGCAASFDVHQCRQAGARRGRVKIPPFGSVSTRDSDPMSEFRPTPNHCTYGGHFDISTEGECGSGMWRKQGAEDGEGRPSIPSNFRLWESVGNSSDTIDGNSLRFRVVSYNVLAQYLLECHPYLYTKCSPRDLHWREREARLYREIINLNPDILCLQEVQESHIQSFYSNFEKIGYFGLFKRKTGQSKDGCAIYFKQSLFQLDDQVSVEYYQPELPLLNRDNIGMMVKLTPRNRRGPSIVVATTHLLYNPKRTDVRLAQMQVLLAELDRFAYYNNGSEFGHLPIILTGDFNSTPESVVVQLLDRGHVSASSYRDNSDWGRIAVTDQCQHLSVYLNRLHGRKTHFCNTMIHNSDYRAGPPSCNGELPSPFRCMFNSGQLRHSLQLASVYTKHKLDGSLEATTYQDNWLTVDYIYFSKLRLVERLRLPTAAECEALGKLPNDVYASDHLALAALFELTNCKSHL